MSPGQSAERTPTRPRTSGRLDLVELWALGQSIDRLVQDELRRRKGSGTLLAVLAAASRGPMTTSELADVLGQAFMTTSDQVDRLENRHEVRRIPNPADGRSRLIEVTARGQRRLQASGPHIRMLANAIAGRLETALPDVRVALADLRRAIDLTAADLEVEA
jgi:DNA-binding MarR family transcriptional regulator